MSKRVTIKDLEVRISELERKQTNLWYYCNQNETDIYFLQLGVFGRIKDRIMNKIHHIAQYVVDNT